MARSPLRLLNFLSLSGIALALLLAGFRFVPLIRIPVLMAAGRSPVCSLDAGLDSSKMIGRHIQDMSEVEKASRLVESSGGYELWATPQGPFWIPAGEKSTLASILTEQQHEIYGLGKHGVRAGDIVIDGGAHVGAFTRRALAEGAAKVIAVEPSPRNRAALERNLAAAIAEGRVIIAAKGVWHEESVLPFYENPLNSAAATVVDAKLGGGHDHAQDHLIEIRSPEHMVEVPLVTIDQLVADLGLERVDFIKLDIEGAEQNALRGAIATLNRWKPRIGVATYHLPNDQVEVPRIVMAANSSYQMECGPCGEQGFRIIPHTLSFF